MKVKSVIGTMISILIGLSFLSFGGIFTLLISVLNTGQYKDMGKMRNEAMGYLQIFAFWSVAVFIAVLIKKLLFSTLNQKTTFDIRK